MEQRRADINAEPILLSYLTGERRLTAERDLHRYLEDEPFTGRMFEKFADNDRPNELTANDLLAVSMLGVDVPASCAIWILGDGASQISELLRLVPSDTDIWEASDEVFDVADGLWKMLDKANWPEPRKPNNMGPTRISKLLAAKRPRLLPINDSVVRAALGHPLKFWDTIRRAMPSSRSPVVAAASELQRNQLSVLRVVDVVVWMAHSHPIAGDPPLPTPMQRGT